MTEFGEIRLTTKMAVSTIEMALKGRVHLHKANWHPDLYEAKRMKYAGLVEIVSSGHENDDPAATGFFDGDEIVEVKLTEFGDLVRLYYQIYVAFTNSTP